MQFIKATPADLPLIMQIINDAKQLLKSNGIDQWQQGYPDEQTMLTDIAEGNLYFAQEDGEKVAILALIFEADPNYDVIEDGEWISDQPYSVLHRVAVAKEKLGTGVMGRIIAHTSALTLEKGLSSTRIDTHKDNQSMQRALMKASYQYCGNIYTYNGDTRLAFEKLVIAQKTPVMATSAN